MLCPATVTTALRANAPGFGATAKPTEPLPTPLVDESVTQGTLEEAIQEQLPAEAVTAADPLPPDEGWVGLLAEIENPHASPAWEIV